ncbi:Trm112 family protein [Xanthomonadaceae bacterium JHOS43]|nr:Trm112 family protein [Xanthomonadaceae bacterium JHOS43]
MTLDKRLLEILRCPASGEALQPATPAQLDAINRSIAAGTARRGDGTPASVPLDAALRTASGRIYRIDDGIPVMLASESIQTEPASDSTG